MPEQFQQRWGYTSIDNLASLFRPVGDWKRVRHDYFQLVLEQFIEHWSKPYHDYCQRIGLECTGHYWDHEWPDAIPAPTTWRCTPGISGRPSTA